MRPDATLPEPVPAAEATRVVLMPFTGEVLDLAVEATPTLAEAVHRVREAEAELRSFKRAVADELLARMDHEASWTIRVPRWEVTGDGPNRTDYDGKALRMALSRLAATGAISVEAAREAVRVEEVYTPVKAKLHKLLKLGGEVAEAIRECEVPSTSARQVRVKPRPDSER